MHIAYLSQTADIRGGGERSLVELMRHAERELGHRITLIAPEGPLQEEAAARTGAHRTLLPFTLLRRTTNPLRLAGYAARYALAVRRLRRVLRRLRPDVLHANSAPAALYAGLATVGTGIPVIWHMRDIQPPKPTFRLVLPFIGRLSTHVVAISAAVKRNVAGFGIPEEKITVVYNAVRPQPPGGGEEFRASHRISRQAVLFAVVGQMLHRKGQLTAVRALDRIRDRDVHLVLCGGNLDSDYGERVRSEVQRLGLDGRVTFTGFMREPGPVFDAMDVLVVPSNQEPFGRVVVEGMLSGKPLVATRVGGIPELVREGKDALLVRREDAAALAAAMGTLADDPARRASMGRSGREWAEHRFSWEARTREGQLAGLYRRVATARSQEKEPL